MPHNRILQPDADVRLAGFSDALVVSRISGLMSTRRPETRAEFVRSAILWLRDAIDEERYWSPGCESSQWCLRKAIEEIERAIALG